MNMKVKAKILADMVLNQSHWFTYQMYLEKMRDMYPSSAPVSSEQWDLIIACTGNKKTAYSHHLKDEAKLLLKSVFKKDSKVVE